MSSLRTYMRVSLATGTLFLYLVGLVFRLPQVFFMCGVFFLAPLLSYALAWASLRRLRCCREAPDRLTEDDSGEVCLRLTNEGWLPKFMLRVTDSLPPPLETPEGEKAECIIPVLWWKETFTYRYRVTASLRGRHRIGPIQVQAMDIFDLFTTRVTIGGGHDLIVYPAPVTVREDAFWGGRRQGSSYLPRGATFSEGVDFYSIREYQPGDDLRRIHWKTTARLNQFSVLEFEQDFSTHLGVFLDAQKGLHVGRGKQSTFEYGVKLAVSLARRELDRGNAVGLRVHGDTSLHLPAASGPAHWFQILEALAVIQPEGTIPLAQLVEEAQKESSPASTIVLISPQISPAVVKAVGSLGERQIQVVYFLLDVPSFLPTTLPANPAEEGLLTALIAVGARVYRVRRGADLGTLEEVRYAREREAQPGP